MLEKSKEFFEVLAFFLIVKRVVAKWEINGQPTYSPIDAGPILRFWHGTDY